MDLHEKTDIYEIPDNVLELWAFMHLGETELEEGDFGGMAEEDFMGTLLGEDELADPYVALLREYRINAFYIDESIKNYEYHGDETKRKEFIVKRRQNRLKFVREGRELQEEHRWHGNISQC